MGGPDLAAGLVLPWFVAILLACRRAVFFAELDRVDMFSKLSGAENVARWPSAQPRLLLLCGVTFLACVAPRKRVCGAGGSGGPLEPGRSFCWRGVPVL